ncbi:pilin [Yinghuangia sp. YIM S09857]|uniref:pilin n=1 Tax=Yinghuangia sp. YIM S09857 TaxID=3436929 RepID=UPI003F5362B8
MRFRVRRTLLPTVPAAVLLALADAQSAYAVNSIPVVIQNTRNWITGILAATATLFLTVGGLRYLLAGGDPGEVEKAKSALKAAAIGYMLAVLAPIILQILQGFVGDTTPTAPQSPAPPPVV